MNQVLLTGSAGSIGRIIGPTLIQAGHAVRGVDLQPTDWADDHRVGDLADPTLLRDALIGIDTVIHLAAIPYSRSPFDDLLEPNYVAPRRLVDAAAEAGTVRRLVLASTMQIYNGLATPPIDAVDQVRLREQVAPTNDYALSKVWLEHLGEWAARTHAWAVLAVRIGWFPRGKPEMDKIRASPGFQGIYFSHADTASFFQAAVESDFTSFQIVNAISRPAAEHSRCSLEPAASVLGWAPAHTWPDGSAPLT